MVSSPQRVPHTGPSLCAGQGLGEVSASQHGLRSLHSTTSALLLLSHQIALGLNLKRFPIRTVSMVIDFFKAFDLVPHDILLSLLSSCSLPHNVVRWTSAYLYGRQAFFTYKSRRSSTTCLVVAAVPPGLCVVSNTLQFLCKRLPNICSPRYFLCR